MQLPIDHRLSASAHFSRSEMEQTRYPVDNVIRRNLARNIAENIQGKALQRIDHEFGTEFRMDVYVLSPKELYQMIDAAVERHQLHMPPNMDIGVQVLP